MIVTNQGDCMAMYEQKTGQFEHLQKKRKSHVWPYLLLVGMITGYGIQEIRDYSSMKNEETLATHLRWSKKDHRLTKEQATNPGTLIHQCTADLKREGIIADSRDVRDAISAYFEKKYGKKLAWGDLEENKGLPLPDICEKRYIKE